jgi:AcrR family transcriptional regulator
LLKDFNDVQDESPAPDGLVAEQKAARRSHILAVARQLIVERGYDGVTMRDLAAVAGVSVPTLYNLCGGKDDLLRQAVAAGFDPVSLSPARRLRGHRRMLAILETGAEEIDRQPGLYRSMLAMVTRSRQAQVPMLDIGARLHAEVLATLDELHDLGQLAPWVDRPVLAERLTATCVTAALEWAAGFATPRRSRAITFFTACTMLAAATTGTAQDAFLAEARRAQRELARRPGRPQPRP